MQFEVFHGQTIMIHWDNESLDPVADQIIWDGYSSDFLYPFVTVQCCFNFSQLDPIPATLDHVVTPANVNPVISIFVESYNVPGPVGDLFVIWLVGITYKVASRFLCIAPITLRDARTA